MTPVVVAILVTHDSAEDLPEAIESLRRSSAGIQLRIVVVDCGSADSSVEVARALNVDEVIAVDNLGFVAGNNLGARSATARDADWLLMMNPDTRIISGDLSKLIARAERSNASLIAPAFTDRNGSGEPEGSIMYSDPDPLVPPGWFKQLLDRRLSSFFDRWTPVTESEMEVSFVDGACAAYRKSEFDASGGFDERYFQYNGEIAWQGSNLRRGGIHIASTDLTVIHDKDPLPNSATAEPHSKLIEQYIVTLLLRTRREKGRVIEVLRRLRGLFSAHWIGKRRWPGGADSWRRERNAWLARIPDTAEDQRKLQTELLGGNAR